MEDQKKYEVVPMSEFLCPSTRQHLVETIAAACHQQNKKYCKSIEDDSQVSWREAPKWQQDSAIHGVEAALEGATPEELHESWMDQKKKDGWVYGPVKNPETKTHYCMVPYAELLWDQREKDILFGEMVTQLGLVLGLIRQVK